MLKLQLYMQREIVGRGIEHIVWRDPSDPNYVYKKPTLTQHIFLILAGVDANAIVDEIEYSKGLVRNTGLVIPETTVVIERNRFDYRIRQRFIEKDSHTPDLALFLREQGTPFFVDKYLLKPQNFIWNQGVLYWVDPTRGFYRILTNRVHIPWEKQIQIMARLIRISL